MSYSLCLYVGISVVTDIQPEGSTWHRRSGEYLMNYPRGDLQWELSYHGRRENQWACNVYRESLIAVESTYPKFRMLR